MSPRRANGTEGAEPTLTRLARQACHALDADGAAVVVCDDDEPGSMVLLAGHGITEADVGRRFGMDEGLAGEAIAAGAPVLTDDYRTYARRIALQSLEAMRAAGAAPICWSGRTRGALSAISSDPARRFGAREREMLCELADVAAAVLEHAETRGRLESMMQAGIETLAALIDLRDGYTGRHSDEVVGLALAVGRRMGLRARELSELGIAARLHDIGKIGVSDTILRKPGPLDEAEWTVMKRHVVWGAETIERIPGLEGVARAVRFHHERWDGEGYPSGLEGDDIPVASRIIGACDAYAAMTSDRPYRRALSAGKAQGLLERGAGAQFDRRVVAALADELAGAWAPASGREAGEPKSARAAAARGGRFGRPDASAPAAAVAAQPGTPSATRAPPAGGMGHRLPVAFERLEGLPALAESRERLLRLLAGPRASVADIVSVIESDVALAIAVLRAANDRPSGPARGVAGVPEAVELLSPAGVEALVARIATFDFFERVPGWDPPPERFRLHAVATQRAAERLARRVSHRDRDELLVAALLHDIGKLVLAEAYPGYPDRIHGAARTPEQRLQAEWRELGIDHAAVGGVLARRWRLPDRVATTIERHHEPAAEPAARLVRLADMLAHYGHGRAVDPGRLLDAARALGLGPGDLRVAMYELSDAGPATRRTVEPSPLSGQETEALRQLAQGKVYKQIAADLRLSASTVRTHLHNAYRKLGAADRAQAVLIATERGWV